MSTEGKTSSPALARLMAVVIDRLSRCRQDSCNTETRTQEGKDRPGNRNARLTLPMNVSPVLYLEVKMAGPLSYTMEGSMQFRVLVLSEESRNCDSLKVQLPHEKVREADGPAHMHRL